MKATLVFSLYTLGCGNAVTARSDDAATEAPMANDAEVTADAPSPIRCQQALPALTPVAANEQLYPGCSVAPVPLVPFPTIGCTLDLRGLRAGDNGTCGDELATRGPSPAEEFVGKPIVLLPTNLTLVIQLPQGAGNDAACATLCNDDTGFSVRFEIDWALRPKFTVVRVDPPWYFVTGNETDPTFCFNGKPSVLEFGLPLACIFTYGSNFSIATKDPNPPPSKVVLEQSNVSNEFSGCCLYPRAN
jgi:hypothetical protein